MSYVATRYIVPPLPKRGQSADFEGCVEYLTRELGQP